VAVLHAAGLAHGALHGDNVFVCADGSITITDAGVHVAGRTRRTAQADDLQAVATLVDSLWRTERRRGAADVAALLTGPQLSAAGSAEAALAELTAALEQRQELLVHGRAGLRALVARVPSSDVPALADAPPAMPAGGDPAAADRLRRAREALAVSAGRVRRRRMRRRGAVLLMVICVLAGAAVGGWRLATHARSAPAQPDGTAEHARTPAAVAPAPTRAPTPAPATASAQPSSRPPAAYQPALPAAVGFISDAVLQAEGQCQPGQACTLTSRIDLAAHADATVDWELVAVDQCTGAQTVLATHSLDAVADYAYVYATDSVALPGSDPLSLYTVTTAPLSVESAALAGATAGGRCAAPSG